MAGDVIRKPFTKHPKVESSFFLDVGKIGWKS
jgi:hypothetical protein